jgi:methionyl-tRNA synthetase
MAWNDGEKEKYKLPQNVPANEFLNFEGKKFSKSRNWGIDVIDFLEIFRADPLRYTLAANLPETRDTDFYWREFQLRNNSELADILGNFINRTFTFVHKHFDGKVPVKCRTEEKDEKMLELLSGYPSKVSEFFDCYKIKDGVTEIMNLARAGNKYFNDSEPWVTLKSDKEKCGTTLNIWQFIPWQDYFLRYYLFHLKKYSGCLICSRLTGTTLETKISKGIIS